MRSRPSRVRPGTSRATVEIATLGCSLGAFHAANFALKRADLFPLAMCFSGNYDPASWHAWGAELLAAKCIRHELDLWGFDVPHDWPSWRAQLARHMPRFC